MIYVNHTARTISREQAARNAAGHVAGVIRQVGPDHAATLLAETLPHWTKESFHRASQPENLTKLYRHFFNIITVSN